MKKNHENQTVKIDSDGKAITADTAQSKNQKSSKGILRKARRELGVFQTRTEARSANHSGTLDKWTFSYNPVITVFASILWYF
jgi:hypothetical protein